MLTAKRMKWWMSAALVMAAILMAACQPAADTSAAAQAQTQGQGQGQGFGNGQRPNFQMQSAPELPTTQPTGRGTVVSVSGTTLTIREGGGFGGGAGGGAGGGNFGGGNGTPRAPQNSGPQDGTPRVRPTQSPATEVQVDASSATVYEDVTSANLNGQPPSGTLQQKVVASSVDKIPVNARVTIWAEGTSIPATVKVIVFTQPRAATPQP